MAFYKRAGAKYFMAMANHHDNLDLWDSTYQPWSSVMVGPKKTSSPAGLRPRVAKGCLLR